MRSTSLMLSLKRFVDKVLRPEFPRIGLYIGGIPSDAENVFPFVVLRLSDGDGEGTVDGGYECEDKVMLHIGVMEMDDPEEAMLTCLGVSDTLRIALRRARLLENIYELGSLRVAIPDPERKQHDYHLMTLITSWHYLVPAYDAGNDYRDDQFVQHKE